MYIGKQDKVEILENALTYIVVFAMFVYGIGKIIQFNGAIETKKMVSEMTGMQLMWAFYGYSKPFAVTLGVLEVTGGILMLIKRTRILGCLFVSIILVNVILQDIFYGVNIGALRAAIIYQSSILLILWLNKNKLIQSIGILMSSSFLSQSKKAFFIKILLSILLFIIFRVLEFYVTTKW
jgi:hypothetical protein